MDLGLRDRVAVVTGASSGIGYATALSFLTEGASVGICARRPEQLAAAAARLAEAVPDGRVLARTCDVLDEPAFRGFVDDVTTCFGGVDVLVNNAGVGARGNFATTTDEAWLTELNEKLMSLVRPTRVALPHLTARNGVVVNVNGVLAREPDPEMIGIGAARAAALNASRALARELAPSGVRVNAVLLGAIATDWWSRRWEAADTGLAKEEWLSQEAMRRGIPLGRLGSPQEVADCIVFLASSRAGYTTGAFVEVDGGLSRSI